MGSHLTDPWYWFYTLLGLAFYVVWLVTELLPVDARARLQKGFGEWRFWPTAIGLSAGGASSAALDMDPATAVGLGAIAYFLTGMNPKAGKDAPWLAKNVESPRK